MSACYRSSARRRDVCCTLIWKVITQCCLPVSSILSIYMLFCGQQLYYWLISGLDKKNVFLDQTCNIVCPFFLSSLLSIRQPCLRSYFSCLSLLSWSLAYPTINTPSLTTFISNSLIKQSIDHNSLEIGCNSAIVMNYIVNAGNACCTNWHGNSPNQSDECHGMEMQQNVQRILNLITHH